MNDLPQFLKSGTFGELLVQLRLFQFDVQAVAPHKDTGDLLALFGRNFRAVQVKTSAEYPVRFNRTKSMLRLWDVLAIAVVPLAEGSHPSELRLDECDVFLLPRAAVGKGNFSKEELLPFAISHGLVYELFAGPNLFEPSGS